MEKDMKELMEEESVETFEFTDDEGLNHCFVVESRFKVGQDDYVALLEVDPAIFEESETCDCGCDHEHGHAHDLSSSDECGCGHDYGEEVEEPNIILAKITEDENGEVDIQVPTDEEFEKAKSVYETLDA